MPPRLTRREDTLGCTPSPLRVSGLSSTSRRPAASCGMRGSFTRRPTLQDDTDGCATKPCEVARKSSKRCKRHAACQGGIGREKLRGSARPRNSVTHALREAELKFQTQNTCGLRECKLEEALTIMRHHLLDAYFMQETWRTVADIDQFKEHHEFYIIEHGLPVKRCRRGSVGLAIVLNERCRAAFQRAGHDSQTFGERILTARLVFRDRTGKEVKFYLVNAYQPSYRGTRKSMRALDTYYDNLRDCLQARGKDEILIMAADANASLGTAGDDLDAVTGHFGNPHRNDAGTRLREFCNAHALCAPSTFFQKKEYDTWKHMRNCRRYQLDHFFVLQRDRKRVVDAAVNRKYSPMLHSDHTPVYLRFRLARSLSHKSNCGRVRTYINVELLRQKSYKAALTACTLQEYNRLADNFNGSISNMSAQESWDLFEQSLKTAEAKVLTQTVRQHKGWFQLREPQLTVAIARRNEAMRVLMQCKGTFADHAPRRQELREAHAAVRKQVELAKKEWFAARLADVGLFKPPRVYWQAIRDLKRGIGEGTPVIPQRFASEDDPSVLCSTPAENADRVQGHFEKVLNIPSTYSEEQIQRVRQRRIRLEMDDKFTKAELLAVLEDIKTGKACGKDGQRPEYYKAIADLEIASSAQVFDIFLDIIHKVWEEGAIPSGWHDNILSVIYKRKGKKSDLNNYRGIMLKAVAVKILGALIQRRLQRILKEEGLPEQEGFTFQKAGRNATFSLKSALQKRAEHGLGSWVAFIDLVKAFDSVPRAALFTVLQKFGVPPRMLSVLQALHEGVRVELKVADEKRYFDSTTGVLQGSTEAPALFVLYFQACLEVYDMDAQECTPEFQTAPDEVLTGRDTRKLHRGQSPFKFGRSLFADDAAVLWQSREDLQSGMIRLHDVLRDFGLTMHLGRDGVESKTVCVYFPPRKATVAKTRIGRLGKPICIKCGYSGFYKGVCQADRCYREHLSGQNVSTEAPAHSAPYDQADRSDLAVADGIVPFVDEFKYLGTILHHSLSDLPEVEARISSACKAFGALRQNILCCKQLPLKVRVDVFNSFVLGVLCYGMEHWALTEKIKDRLISFHRRCVRDLLGVNVSRMWRERISQQALEAKASILDFETLLTRRRLKWLGVVAAMSPDSLPSKFLASWVAHPRPAGQPRQTVARSYKRDLKAAGLQSDNWRQVAATDPKGWIETVAAVSLQTRDQRRHRRRQQRDLEMQAQLIQFMCQREWERSESVARVAAAAREAADVAAAARVAEAPGETVDVHGATCAPATARSVPASVTAGATREHETEAWGRLIFVETSPVPATSSSHAVPDPPPLPGLSSPSPAPPAPHAPPPLHPSTTSIPAVFAEQIVKWFEDQNQRREARRQKKKEPTPPPPPPPPSDPPPQPRYRSRSGRETNRVNYREPQRAHP